MSGEVGEELSMLYEILDFYSSWFGRRTCRVTDRKEALFMICFAFASNRNLLVSSTLSVHLYVKAELVRMSSK